jgi:hypothetical protein
VTYRHSIGHGGKGHFCCPGYYDDDEYQSCDFRTLDVPRVPWKHDGHESPTKTTCHAAPQMKVKGVEPEAKACAKAALKRLLTPAPTKRAEIGDR